MKKITSEQILTILRISLGFIFLWTFISKMSYWLNGASPTTSFLEKGTEGPLAAVFSAMSGSPIVDILFMAGMLLIGSALILGMGVRIAGYTGSLMMLLIYLSIFPPENNPLVDEHIIYILVLLFFSSRPEVGEVWGLGKYWKKRSVVKKYPILA